ncbi:MAG TPA: DUF1285 domain-containing protein, partial [Planctomycetes bacterium]|nr:DUF1285 domain-containing protein [Planctomycetota bacterium]
MPTDATWSKLAATLSTLEQDAPKRSLPPVESWDPPYCGDIGLKIGADGTWYYQSSPIRRQPLVKLFASVLRKDSDGRTYLVTPAEKVDVEVEDAPFLAVEMEVQQAGSEVQQLILRTNVGDVVRCGPEHPLRFALQEPDGGLKPYVRVRGRLDALLTRALTYELAELAAERNQDGRTIMGVWSGGEFFAIPDAPDSAVEPS